MIDFYEHIYYDLIDHNLNASTKEQAIKFLLNKIYQKHKDFAGSVSEEDAYNEIMDREGQQSTGLGEAMAFPHARISGWGRFVIVIGYCPNGIDFDSMDNEKAKFIFLMISSQDNPYVILKSMSNIIKFLSKTKDIKSIFEKRTSHEIGEFFKRLDFKEKKLIEAQDIMMPLSSAVNMEDPIDKAVNFMHLEKVDVLPVVDNEGKLKGQISCFNIFEHEIPEFFNQLHTISFVRHIDPFEKFFKLQKDLKVKDYLKEECVTINHNATLIEVIFMLSIKNNPRLFVLKEEKLVGIIDRFSVLERVLFF